MPVNLALNESAGALQWRDTPGIRRAMFHVFLRAHANRATGEEKAALEQTLATPEIFNAVCETYSSQINFSDGATSVQPMAGTPLQDFLNWLLKNAPQIIAFIMQIVQLFIHIPTPTPAPAA